MKYLSKLDRKVITNKNKHDANLFKAKMVGKTRTEIIEQVERDRNEKFFENAICISEIYNISGVYFLFKDKKIVYIGESECVFRRISQHIGKKDFDHFKYILYLTEKERKGAEKALIKKYRPIYNYTHNLNVSRL